MLTVQEKNWQPPFLWPCNMLFIPGIRKCNTRSRVAYPCFAYQWTDDNRFCKQVIKNSYSMKILIRVLPDIWEAGSRSAYSRKDMYLFCLYAGNQKQSVPLHWQTWLYIKGTLQTRRVLQKAMEGCTHVYHTAAVAKYQSSGMDRFYEVNVTGTRNILKQPWGLIFRSWSLPAVLQYSGPPGYTSYGEGSTDRILWKWLRLFPNTWPEIW